MLRAVFPGKSQAALQAFGVADWDDSHLVAFISCKALIILRGPRQLIQTISHDENDDDDELQAVTVNGASLKIAVCTKKFVYIYQPLELEDGAHRWILQDRLSPDSDETCLTSLAWGYHDEILAAGEYLTLFRSNPTFELWTRKLANPAKIVSFAHDASLIATTGKYDKLVKIWRRVFVGGDTERFDSTYLPHPGAVTDLGWRGKPETEEHVEYVLYTTCVDGKLRVWTATDHHGLQTLQLWVELDLFVAMPSMPVAQDQHPERRFAIILDTWKFTSLANNTAKPVQDAGDEEKPAINPFQEILDREPELCLVLDDRGNMSSWGLERVGCKARQETNIFNIHQAVDFELDFRTSSGQTEHYTVVRAFASRDGSTTLNLLVQHFDGRIQWFSFPVEATISQVDAELAMLGNWTGHSSPIDSLTVFNNGLTLKSQGPEETMLWGFKNIDVNMPLEASDTPVVNGHPQTLMNPVSLNSVRQNFATLQLDVSEVSISDGHKVATLDSTRQTLSIWDTKNECLEYVAKFQPHEAVICMRWTTTEGNNSILAFALPHKVLVLVEAPYDFSHRRHGWIHATDIDITSLTNIPIADVAWMSGGNLVLAAGLQMFQYRPVVESSVLERAGLTSVPHSTMALLNAAESLHCRLAIYHPDLLSELVASGQLEAVDTILSRLAVKLKFYTEGDPLDPFLGIDILTMFQNQDRSGEVKALFTEEASTGLVERLATSKVPYLTLRKQKDLELLVESFGSIERQRKSVDEAGLQYLLAFQRDLLGSAARADGETQLSWRETCWALRCDSQDILVDLISKAHQGRLLWRDARDTGLFMWLSDAESIRNNFEAIARNEYSKTDERNPTDCTLYYLALKKKQVLVGLWRMAGWHREQRATLKLLTNDFEDARWRTTALKNAYALLGKRRLEYAAAFFLLAGQLKDACSVIATQVQDLQLAIAIARVYEGDGGPVLKELLQDIVLPQAARDGDRWLASWAYLLLDRRDLAAEASYKPLEHLVSLGTKPVLDPLSYLRLDPSLVYWYKHLRDEVDPAYRGPKLSPSPKSEWALVMRSLRIYSRMACDVLSMYLFQTWSFAKLEHQVHREPVSAEIKPSKQLDNYMDDGMNTKAGAVQEDMEKVLTVDGKPRVKVEAEPSTASILDAFDF